jgi:hypothetical protein
MPRIHNMIVAVSGSLQTHTKKTRKGVKNLKESQVIFILHEIHLLTSVNKLYVPLPYILHLTDSCPFSKEPLFAGGLI